MSEYESRFYRLLVACLSALERVPMRTRTNEQKYCIEQITKELKSYERFKL